MSITWQIGGAAPLLIEIEFGLPLEEPVLVFMMALGVFLIAPLIIKRLGQPGIVGIVVVGAAIGPNGFGLVEHVDAIVLLGTVGLVYLLFTVGLEMNLRGFFKAPENAALFGLTSFFIPLIVGIFLMMNVLAFPFWPALLLAAVFASHTLLAYPVVNRFDITQNRAVTAVFGGILFTDTIALIILAIVMGTVDGDLSTALFLQIFAAVFVLFLGVWYLVPPIARWFFRNLSDESYFEFLFVLFIVFVAASLAHVLGLDAILGAFVAGIAFNRLVSRGGTLMNRIEFVGNAFFIPFFLLHVGMLVNPRVIMDGWRTIEVAVVIIGVMLVTKFVAAWVVGAIQGYDSNERGIIFGLSIGQAAAALAITLLGFEAGLFGTHVLNAVVLMLLVTAILSPAIVERFSRRLVMESEVVPREDQEIDPRILLPLSTDPDRRRDLLELAFVLKERYGRQPIHLLTVIQPQWAGETEDHVAEIEQELSTTAEFGGAAETSVEIETRVNHNIASGIIHGAIETQADMIVLGWEAQRSFGRRIFGNIIDQVLERTDLPVFVARLGHPVNTTQDIHVVIPKGIDHHEGFYEGIYHTKLLADKLGTGIHLYIFEDNVHQFQRLYDMVEIDIEGEFKPVKSWSGLNTTLASETDEDDLVMVLSPRPGKIGWDDQLRTLPNTLIGLPPHSFLVMYLREDEPEYDAKFLKMD